MPCRTLSAGRDHAPRNPSYFDGDQYQIVYCFAAPEDAQEFAERFGGRLISPAERPKVARASSK
jgi:hypothetical protein